MKISVHDDMGKLTLKIEGRIIGDWATELKRTWDGLKASLGSKKLCLDICDVIYLDDEGKRILHGIFAATGAEFLADSPLTKQFVNEIKKATRNSEGDETEYA